MAAPAHTALLVFRDSIIRDTLALILRDSVSLECRKADSVQQALNAVSEQLPDIVITEYYLPDGNGCRLASAIRFHPHTAAIAIVLMSSFELSPDEAFRVGVDELMPMPSHPQDLIPVVMRLLDSRAAFKAAQARHDAE